MHGSLDQNVWTRSTTCCTGRGKSASLGLAIAAAVSYGYSNIFVTSPSPENLTTLFKFVFEGFTALGYEEHSDYELIQSSNPEFNKAIVRVNIFRESHRQTIQYIQPQDAHKLGQAELVCIDEAAAIPMPLVKALLGPYLVFLASTIHGYEGTGRLRQPFSSHIANLWPPPLLCHAKERWVERSPCPQFSYFASCTRQCRRQVAGIGLCLRSHTRMCASGGVIVISSC
jgi:hypothetical protein